MAIAAMIAMRISVAATTRCAASRQNKIETAFVATMIGPRAATVGIGNLYD